MKQFTETTINEWVVNNYRTASVFTEYGIDFCCGGERTIEMACSEAGIDPAQLEAALKRINEVAAPSPINFSDWPLDLLVDYIEKKHHRFVEEKLEQIPPLLEKVCRVHGDMHPELLEINELFLEARSELTKHMKKEELILFPRIRGLQAKASSAKMNLDTLHFPISAMQEEHTKEGERFKRISEISNRYTPPKDACNSYTLVYSLLKEFEADLHLHIHVENAILFPKVLAL